MRSIKLSGKYAVGKYADAIVDDEDYPALSQWKWKAKPNGGHNHIYAIRSVKLSNGKYRDIRMHRVVIGIEYDGVLDVDHINRNSLDNRKQNLRLVSRSINLSNTSDEIKRWRRDHIRKYYQSAVLANQKRWMHSRLQGQFCPVQFRPCEICQTIFRIKRKTQRFCSHLCLRYHKNHRIKPKIDMGSAKCPVCGLTFKRIRLNHKYCKEACRLKHQIKTAKEKIFLGP